MNSFLCDTSVLVAATIEGHPHHAFALAWIKSARQGRIRILCSTHILAEIYSTLTKPSLPQPLAPDFAAEYILEHLLSSVRPVELNEEDYKAALRRVATKRKKSGAIYDALHVQAALKAQCDGILSFDEADFSILAGSDIPIINPAARQP